MGLRTYTAFALQNGTLAVCFAARGEFTMSSLVTRVQNILMTPKTEWPVIAAEPETTAHGARRRPALPGAPRWHRVRRAMERRTVVPRRRPPPPRPRLVALSPGRALLRAGRPADWVRLPAGQVKPASLVRAAPDVR